MRIYASHLVVIAATCSNIVSCSNEQHHCCRYPYPPGRQSLRNERKQFNFTTNLSKTCGVHGQMKVAAFLYCYCSGVDQNRCFNVDTPLKWRFSITICCRTWPKKLCFIHTKAICLHYKFCKQQQCRIIINLHFYLSLKFYIVYIDNITN